MCIETIKDKKNLGQDYTSVNILIKSLLPPRIDVQG